MKNNNVDEALQQETAPAILLSPRPSNTFQMMSGISALGGKIAHNLQSAVETVEEKLHIPHGKKAQEEAADASGGMGEKTKGDNTSSEPVVEPGMASRTDAAKAIASEAQAPMASASAGTAEAKEAPLAAKTSEEAAKSGAVAPTAALRESATATLSQISEAASGLGTKIKKGFESAVEGTEELLARAKPAAGTAEGTDKVQQGSAAGAAAGQAPAVAETSKPTSEAARA